MNVRFITGSGRKHLLESLKERFGIVDPGFLFLETGKQKIRAFSGSLSSDDIMRLSEHVRIELIGTYFARQDELTGLRLSFDAPLLEGVAVVKGIIDISDEELPLWMQGESFLKDLPVGIYVVRHKQDFVGCGYSGGKKLLNYVPRERQVKKRVKQA
jgi:NOL1/NOP2/fmu family ribosome biogenesis protein